MRLFSEKVIERSLFSLVINIVSKNMLLFEELEGVESEFVFDTVKIWLFHLMCHLYVNTKYLNKFQRIILKLNDSMK